MKKYRKNIIILVMGALLFGSCRKILERQTTHASSENLQWTSISDTRSAVIGMYGLMRAALTDNYRYWMYGELRMGDLVPYNRSEYKLIASNQLKSGLPLIQQLEDWRRFYAVINAASVLIEKAPKVFENDPQYSEQNMIYDIAQARALRAFTYFYMVRIWGDVPLLSQSFDNGTFPEIPKTDAASVLAYAKNELLSVIPDLPFRFGINGQQYYGESSSTWDGILLTKISAYAILAHIAAWESNYVETEVYTRFFMDNYKSSAIDSTNTAVLTQPNGLFSRENGAYNSRQIIGFSASNATGELSQEGHIESLTLAQPLVNKTAPELYVPKDSIHKIFTEFTDYRFGLDTATGIYRSSYFTNYSDQIPVFSKIKVIRGGVTDGTFSLFSSSIIFTRYEELVLLRAEAFAALNRKPEAMDMLNIIRKLRGIPAYNELTPEHIVDAVFKERRRELMGEGWRWYDQIRHEKIKRNNPALLELIQTKGIYWPIADIVLNANRYITQNQYWH